MTAALAALALLSAAPGPGGGKLASAGEAGAGRLAEAVPPGPDLFPQRGPEVRPGPSRLLALSLPADAAARALCRAAPRGGQLAVTVRPLARLGERVLALAAGDAGGGSPAVAAATPSALLLFGPDGRLLARRPYSGPPPAPLRRPAAAVAVGDFGGGRVAVRLAGAPAGEVLAFSGGALRPVAPLAGAPLWAGRSGCVFGAFVPGKATLADQFAPFLEAGARPRSASEFVAFGGAPGSGTVAFAAVSGDGAAVLLGPDLGPVGRLDGVGAGLALADLDGDGEPELVASDASAGGEDRVRVLRLPGGELLHASARLPGSILAGAAADLTGDGLDDAVLAAELPGGETELWLVTADPREAR